MFSRPLSRRTGKAGGYSTPVQVRGVNAGCLVARSPGAQVRQGDTILPFKSGVSMLAVQP